MFEPVSAAISCIGFAIAVIGVLTVTISKIDERIDGFKECEERLAHWRWQLEDGQLQLQVWCSIWTRTPEYEDDFYSYLWNHEGYQSIQARLQSLHYLIMQITRLLRQPTSDSKRDFLLPDNRRAWRQMVEHAASTGTASIPPGDHKIGIFRRIAFSLARNDALKEKTERLRTQIQGLDDFATKTFTLLHKSNPYAKVTKEEICELAQLRKFYAQATALGRTTAEYVQLGDKLSWGLELKTPEGDLSIEEWKEWCAHDVDLYVQVKAPPKRVGDRFRTGLGLEEPSTRVLESLHEIELLSAGLVPSEPSCRSRGWFTILERPISKSCSLRRMLSEGVFSSSMRKHFDIERVDLIYGLAHWTTLFWHTSWFSNICKCQIRCIGLRDSITR